MEAVNSHSDDKADIYSDTNEAEAMPCCANDEPEFQQPDIPNLDGAVDADPEMFAPDNTPSEDFAW